MSRDIESIINVTAYATIDATGQFSLLSGFPLRPDEVIIRQVTYNSIAVTKTLLLIQSSIGNQFIGSVANISGFASDPGTRIKVVNPLPNSLTFSLYVPGIIPTPVGAAALGDQISISMDFISYKK